MFQIVGKEFQYPYGLMNIISAFIFYRNIILVHIRLVAIIKFNDRLLVDWVLFSWADIIIFKNIFR